MKKILYILLFVPMCFISSCEEDEDESCTGNSTADLIVGSWEGNTRFMYYPNGDFLECTNFCNSTNNLCNDGVCVTANYNCDGTGFWETSDATEGFTWSYDPQTEMITTVSSGGLYVFSVITLNSNQLICQYDNMFFIDENGNQIDFYSITVETRIN